MSDSFLDSNILIYLASEDVGKATQAERILADGGVVSVQVLNEVTDALRRKLRLAWNDVEALVEESAALLDVVPLTLETHRSARAIAKRHNLAFYDASIVASALEAGCTRLITEDMHHGHKIGDLTITNPFR